MSEMSAQDQQTVPGQADENTVGWQKRVGLFLGSQMISLFGSSIVQYAVMWHLTLTLKSGSVIMWYALAAFVPQALLSLFGGALADRMNRKTVIVVADTIIALVTFGLALAMTYGRADLWLILAAVAIRSVGQGFQAPAVGALIPQLTPPSQLLRVNGINQTLNSSTNLLAPAVAGGIYAVGGLVPTFWVDVVTALIAVGIMLTIPVATVRSGADVSTSFMGDLKDGLTYVYNHKKIAWLIVLFSVIFTLIVAPSFLTPLLLARSFSEEVWLLTVNEIVFAGAMALGGVLIATVAVKWHQGKMLAYSSIFFGVFSALMGVTPLLGFWPGLIAFYLLMAATAIAIPFFTAPVNTLIQTSVETEYMGRVSSIINVVVTLGMPFGMVVFGPLADVISVEVILVGTGIAALLFVAVSLAAPIGREVMSQAGTSASADFLGDKTA